MKLIRRTNKCIVLLLAITMAVSNLILPMNPIGFAVSKTPGEQLRLLGLVDGYANGSLGEADQLTRAQMMVILAKLKGEDEEAKYFSGVSKYKDVDVSAWYSSYVAYAEFKGWTSGISKTQFGPNKNLSEQETLAFLIKVLGYTIPNFDKVGEQAQKLGLTTTIPVSLKNASTRGTVFKYMLSSLYAKTAGDGITLGSKMGLVLDEKPSVNPVTYQLVSAKALAQNLIEVKFSDIVTEVDSKLFSVKDSSGKLLDITQTTLMNSKTAWFRVPDMKAGALYDISAMNSVKFSADQYDIDQPSLLSNTTVVDQQTLIIRYSENMDPQVALDTSVYKFDNQLIAMDASFVVNPDGTDNRSEVKIKTSKQQTAVSYKLTVGANLKDLAGNFIKSALEYRTVSFVGKAPDVLPPKLVAAVGTDGTGIKLVFDEESDLDRSTVENFGNYRIYNNTDAASPVQILGATLTKGNAGRYNQIQLKTTKQKVGNLYEIYIKDISDEFGNIVSEITGYRAVFYGQLEDVSGPRLVYSQSISNKLIKVVFDKELNKASAENIYQYKIDKGIQVVKAVLDQDDLRVVYLSTTAQTLGSLYKMNATGLMDIKGYMMTQTGAAVYFSGLGEDKIAPFIASAETKIEGSRTYVWVTYSEPVDSNRAKNTLNYLIDGNIGNPMEVVYINELTYKIRTGDHISGKLYHLWISNVQDLSGNMITNMSGGFSFSGKSVGDSDMPKLTGVAVSDNQTLTAVFNKPLQRLNTLQPISSNGIMTHKDASDPDNYSVFNSAGTAFVAKPNIAYVSKDGKTVSLRFSAATFSSGDIYTLKVNANGLGDDFDNETTALYDLFNMPIETSHARMTFSGSSVSIMKPKMEIATAINRDEIQVKFNMPISLMPDFSSSDISFSSQGKSTVFVLSAYSKVLPNDSTVLSLKTSVSLDSGTNYTMTLNGPSKVRDVFKDQSVDVGFGGSYTSVYVPNISNSGPRVLDVNSGLGDIVVTYSEPIDSADILDYRVGSDIGDVNPTVVEFVDDVHDKIRVYYSVGSVTANKIYNLRILKNAIVDNIGKSNSEEILEQYVVPSGIADPVAMSYAEILNQNTVRLGFSKPVADIKSNLLGSDFVIDNMPPGTTYTLVGAYADGVSVDASSGALSSTTYVTALDIQVNKLFLKDIPYKITFNSDNMSLRTKYGTFVATTDSQTPIGKFDLMSLALSNGVVVTDADTPNFATATITDQLLTIEAVKNQYAKVAYAAALSSADAFTNQNGLSNAFNNANLNLAANKGTPVACNVPGNGTYDILLFFLDVDNRVLGYYLVKNVVVS